MKKRSDILKIIHSNRRATSREELNIPGKIIIHLETQIIEEDIQIINISYEGIQIVFSNNEFLNIYLDIYDNKDVRINIRFKCSRGQSRSDQEHQAVGSRTESGHHTVVN